MHTGTDQLCRIAEKYARQVFLYIRNAPARALLSVVSFFEQCSHERERETILVAPINASHYEYVSAHNTVFSFSAFRVALSFLFSAKIFKDMFLGEMNWICLHVDAAVNGASLTAARHTGSWFDFTKDTFLMLALAFVIVLSINANSLTEELLSPTIVRAKA